jgi:NADPH-dependent ferric siderophore reductase
MNSSEFFVAGDRSAVPGRNDWSLSIGDGSAVPGLRNDWSLSIGDRSAVPRLRNDWYLSIGDRSAVPGLLLKLSIEVAPTAVAVSSR